jgi:hypothetical protein
MASQASFNDPKKPCVAKGQDTKEEETFKDKLDRVATEARQVAHSKNEKPNPIVETGETLHGIRRETRRNALLAGHLLTKPLVVF